MVRALNQRPKEMAMQQQQQQQPQSLFQQFMICSKWVMLILQSLSVTLEVFLHRRMGCRYVGLQALLGAAIIFFWPAFWPQDDPAPMQLFLLIYLFFAFAQRADARKRLKRGDAQEHSYYTGKSLACLLPCVSEFFAKRAIEPILAMTAGMLIESVNAPLGKYLFIAGVGLALTTQFNVHYEQSKAIDMNDAMIDQRHTAERFRRMRGDQFLN
jgi:hypothetical protein